MQGSIWVQLIRRIPAEQEDNLIAVTTAGEEIIVKQLMVVAEDYLIFRGRSAGNTDQARLLLLPWDQLNYLAFANPVPEPEVRAMFGTGANGQPTEGDTTEGPADQAAPPDAPDPATAPAKPTVVSKSLLLARLRARLANNGPRGS
jgi:hypothetical protein